MYCSAQVAKREAEEAKDLERRLWEEATEVGNTVEELTRQGASTIPQISQDEGVEGVSINPNPEVEVLVHTLCIKTDAEALGI